MKARAFVFMIAVLLVLASGGTVAAQATMCPFDPEEIKGALIHSIDASSSTTGECYGTVGVSETGVWLSSAENSSFGTVSTTFDVFTGIGHTILSTERTTQTVPGSYYGNGQNLVSYEGSAAVISGSTYSESGYPVGGTNLSAIPEEERDSEQYCENAYTSFSSVISSGSIYQSGYVNNVLTSGNTVTSNVAIGPTLSPSGETGGNFAVGSVSFYDSRTLKTTSVTDFASSKVSMSGKFVVEHKFTYSSKASEGRF